METIVSNVNFGVENSQIYQPSVLSQVSVHKIGDQPYQIKISSDTHLLLRQKDLAKQLGADSLRSYIDSINQNAPSNLPKLSDDELFQLIEPKSINTLTDAYEYSKYIQSHQDDIKSRYSSIMKAQQLEQEQLDFFNSLHNPDDKQDDKSKTITV